MSSSNSFNICPRCGNSNAMSARYCSRCGNELKIPEEPVVCHNCRTCNTPMANFCRNCGAELRVGSATKICSRCGSEVPADQNVCNCGYVFANTAYVAPVPVRADGTVDNLGVAQNSGKKAKKAKKQKDKVSKGKNGKIYSNKGGRAFAIIAFIFALLFAYYVTAPIKFRLPQLNSYDQGIVTWPEGLLYGYNIVRLFVMSLINGNSIGDTIANNGGIVAAIMAVLVAIFAVAVAIHLLVCFIRIFTSKRSRRSNVCYLILAIISTVAAGLIALFNYVSFDNAILAKIAAVFSLANGWTLGYVLYLIPIYFWFFYLYSLIAKARALKESAPVETNIATL